MYEHWKKPLEKMVKYLECASMKRIIPFILEEDKDSVNRLSYQILNTLIATKEDIKVLALDELNYIEQLKIILTFLLITLIKRLMITTQINYT